MSLRRGHRIAAGVFVALAAAVFVFAVGRPVKVLPRMAPAPPFELLDPWGETVTAPSQGGPIVLYTFGALRDPEGMAVIGRFYRQAKRALAEAGRQGDVSFRFITVDPDHDTPEVLRQALDGPFHDALSGMTLLTGSWVAVRLVVGTGFGVYYEAPAGAGASLQAPGPPRYDPTVVIVDQDHVIRARYSLEGFDTATLLRDINLLKKEADAQGATRWIYEGAHLFLCYPR